VDGVHFAYFKGEYPAELTTLNKWVRSVVSEDAVATDGTPLSAAALSDGTVGVAYSYSYWDPGEERGRQHLMFRLGTWE